MDKTMTRIKSTSPNQSITLTSRLIFLIEVYLLTSAIISEIESKGCQDGTGPCQEIGKKKEPALVSVTKPKQALSTLFRS
ncbi:hypothetical protein LXJ15735_00800 [Lacrimispora xylanolytica]